MKQLLIKFLILITAVIGCHIIFNAILDTGKVRHLRMSTTFRNYTEKKNNIDLLFVGSSHAHCSFNPAVIKNKVNISSYTLGSGEQSYANSYYVLKEALRYHKPKIVIQEVTYRCYKPGLREINAGAGNFDKFDLKDTELYHELAITDRIKYNIKYIHLDLILNSMLINITGKRSVNNIDGYEAWRNTISVESISAIMNAKPDKYNLDDQFYQNMKYIDKIIELCKKEGITLIFVSAPELVYPSNHADIQNYFRNYFNKRKSDFYDFTDGKLVKFIPTMDFKDAGHLNIYGAEKITSYIAEIASQILWKSPGLMQSVNKQL